ncbi:aminotransferase class I/II-fold pyridoxal phosphate-dependent enzyme [Algoriphagus zhangzhouensis]|uniref:dTDP-4-amino-4,6-dideoxygalactose transaminase n=1 Tax=Algoriphagus zhangzhouensis TaxID=1073327 RepID=A0A1M7Z390_9BACT|nr:aminotransferase class I/II-fold pyridoxal phosphate-dependent enzyme [Algoriphagus zhangzhouensis]TDY48381.1 dTDP-4-amino-4,6-dideoxygalactose transaminase [Algoriphagus zhangzhouensis]SHO59428.1 dTDP-4-amino-4,6-dideoxygalactose transaminase [Algoriphagus zhangzhouensis]
MAYQYKLSAPIFDGNELIYSQQAITSGQLATTGSFIDKFESKLSKKLKSHQAVALNSGTSSLHLALVLLGISSGDEVICQSFTFCASANPIIYLGAKPIFVDSEKDTWNMSPELLEDAIMHRIAHGKKPKAIIVVHLFGMPAKMKEIMEIATKYHIPVLEDAAEAVGSKIDEKSCGTFGDIGVYSFNGNKIVSAGGGGALIANDSSLVQKARYLSTQAREDLPYYQHLEIGYNYKMNNLSAAIGLAQIEQLDKCVKKRRQINSNYRKLIGGIPGIIFQNEIPGAFSNYWLSTILINEKVTGFNNDQLRIAFMKNGIETRFLWKPLHMQPVFKEIQFFGGDTSRSFFQKGICLPSSADLTFEDQENIVGVIVKELAKTF